MTAARVALSVTVREGDRLGVEAFATGVRDRVGHISLQSAHEAPHVLTAGGVVRRVEPAGSRARFEGRVGDNHHLVGRVLGEAPCPAVSDDHGFSVDEAEVVYWGLCPGCSTTRSA